MGVLLPKENESRPRLPGSRLRRIGKDAKELITFSSSTEEKGQDEESISLPCLWLSAALPSALQQSNCSQPARIFCSQHQESALIQSPIPNPQSPIGIDHQNDGSSIEAEPIALVTRANASANFGRPGFRKALG